MTNALTPQNLTANTVTNIDLDQIQGDVLIGLQKLAEQFLFFQIKDVAGFKTILRKQIAHRITNGSGTRIPPARPQEPGEHHPTAKHWGEPGVHGGRNWKTHAGNE